MSLQIVRRDVSETPLSPALHPVLDRIYRARNIQHTDELDTRVQALSHYNLLKGIDQASALIVDAIENGKRVTIVGDFDADGATSTAVCMLALRQMGLAQIDYLVPNRFDFGYGLSPQIVDVAFEQGAQVLITVDNGIACLEGVKRARELGLTVIVTDHHLPGPTLPDAHAIVNPNQPGCAFPSPHIAGVGVAFYLMLACRAALQEKGWFNAKGIQAPNLANLLDIVAVGTVADVVRLDKNNRILVHQGLQRIRSGQCRPGLKALIDVANRQLTGLSATDLGFVIGPRLNAAGRLEDMALGIECLICDDEQQARFMAQELDSLNLQRRAIESEMKDDAQQILSALSLEQSTLPSALVLYREDFHQGVIGIVAGKIKEQYARPTIVFAHQDDTIIKGSARSVPGVHIRDVLDEVNTRHPGIISKFGGHAMAAGLSLPLAHLERFKTALDDITAEHMANVGDLHTIYSDGELGASELQLEFAHQLRQAGPFGQGFDAPLFDGVFDLVSQRIVGEKHLKVVCRLPELGEIDGIAFNIDVTQWPNQSVKKVHVAYRVDVNAFRGRETVQLLIEGMSPYET